MVTRYVDQAIGAEPRWDSESFGDNGVIDPTHTPHRHSRLSDGGGDAVPVGELADRSADEFVAKRADADATLVKPIDAGQLRRAAKRILAGPVTATTQA